MNYFELLYNKKNNILLLIKHNTILNIIPIIIKYCITIIIKFYSLFYYFTTSKLHTYYIKIKTNIINIVLIIYIQNNKS